MAYDIPDKIQYKEKIVFGLTLKQLVYAVAFGIPAVLSFGLPLSGDAKFVSPCILALLGLGFIFLDFEKALLERLAYLRGIRQGGAMDKKVQDFIGIRKIENDTVYLANDQMRAVVFIYPINYQNMDKGRQDSIILNYRDFLNQLSHPVQILVRTVNVDMGEYFAHHDERVAKTGNLQLMKLYDDFKVWEKDYLKEHKVKERLYYLIVPYSPADSLSHRNKGKLQILKEKLLALHGSKKEEWTTAQDELWRKELASRTAILQQKLAECSVASRILTTNELISLFMSYFDGYAEVDEDYLSRVVVSKKFFERKEGEEDGKEESQKAKRKKRKSKRRGAAKRARGAAEKRAGKRQGQHQQGQT